jgi:hypothetical protein
MNDNDVLFLGIILPWGNLQIQTDYQKKQNTLSTYNTTTYSTVQSMMSIRKMKCWLNDEVLNFIKYFSFPLQLSV